MDALPLATIAEFAGGTIQSGDPTMLVPAISTDSRTIGTGELFVPLRGENFDGHQFVAQAAERGAMGAIVAADAADGRSNFARVRVADTLIAYQQIAAQYRKSLSLKVVAITGSNGKTSTKDFVASVLAKKFRVTKTEGNLNNHVGLPRTMLSANRTHEIGVWEIGMNHPGEVAPLAALAAPDVAIITNIGIAHIEFMGSREAIAQEKGELSAAVGASGTVILNGDDPFSKSIAERTAAKVIFAGINNGSVRAEEIRQTAGGSEFTILEGAHRCRGQLPVPGLHMVQNAMLAVAAGRAFGLSLEDCAAGLAATPLTQARLQIREIKGVQFIDDSYNANPDSMKAALRTLVELETDGRRIAVLGHMGELGAESERGHREVGEAAAQLRVHQLITIGQKAAAIAIAAKAAGLTNVIAAESHEEAANLLSESASRGDLVLIKGSRLARVERVLEEFAKHATAEVLSR
jgi:UDP-N-acetylmuramoyl-tripeptide--D-alanyl-D-alanine ligase